jgi:3-oxo-5-alpha-steroid 4-dehydrogenase 1
MTSFYPMGKTSVESRFNIPGKWAWFTMEAPGFITLLYIMSTLPKDVGLMELPTTNWVMAGMFVRDNSRSNRV